MSANLRGQGKIAFTGSASSICICLHVHLFFGCIQYLFTCLSRAQVWARCAGWSWEHRAQSAGGTRDADFGSLGLSLWESQSSKCILNNRKLLHICHCVPVLAREPPRDCLSIFCPLATQGHWATGNWAALKFIIIINWGRILVSMVLGYVVLLIMMV